MYSIVRVEEWEISQHRRCLDISDKCYYYMTYDSSSDVRENQQKQIISNIKISKEKLIETPKRQYFKDQGIKMASEWLINTIDKYPVLKEYMWIPAQSSKEKNDEFYDDRLLRILVLVKNKISDFNFYDALSAKETVEKSRESNNRDIQYKLNNIKIDMDFINHLSAKKIAFFDDVITTGSTFKAAQLKIKKIDNDIEVIGIFLAKAVNNNYQG